MAAFPHTGFGHDEDLDAVPRYWTGPHLPARGMKTTAYFDALRNRADRAAIRAEWIERAIRSPVKEMMQNDGRIRRWVLVPEAGNRYLRVVLLADGETVHNAFFDRRFVP